MAQWTTTYTGLIDLLGDYVEDSSSEFTGAVQGCVNRAEERILRDLDLSIFNDSSTTTTANGVTTTAKADLAGPTISIFFTAAAVHAERRSYDYVQSYGGSGRPQYFYEDDALIYWAPVPDSSYAITIRYINRPQPLSASNTTNWLATNVADLLLWGSLIESEAFLIAPERVGEFQAYYAALLGPIRAFWRDNAQGNYEPIAPTPTPERTR